MGPLKANPAYPLVLLILAIAILNSGCDFSNSGYTSPRERREIRGLIDQLGAKDESQRESAIYRLEFYGDKAIPFVIQEIGDENELVRAGVIQVLHNSRSDALQQLMRLLNSDNPRVRADVISIIRPIDYWTEEAIPEITKALNDEDQSVRFQAAFALADVSPLPEGVRPILIKAANGVDAAMRVEAVSAFTKMRIYPLEATPGFILALAGGRDLHEEASKALSGIGTDNLLSLIKMLRSDNPDVRRVVTDTLSGVGFDPSGITKLLVALPYSDDLEVRREAAYSLGLLGPEAAEGVPVLIKLLWDGDAGVRWNAATALGKIGAKASVAITALKEKAEKDASREVRQAAVAALGALEPVASDPMPALIDMLRGDDEGLRYWAVSQLNQMGSDAKKAVPALVELLNADIETELRRDVAYALAQIGPDAADAVPALSIFLLDWDYSTVAAGINALKKIGGDPLPRITNYLKDTRQDLVLFIFQSGSAIGRFCDDAFPAFVDAMKGNDFGTRMGADAIHRGTYPDLTYAISVYKEMLENDDPVVRQHGVFLLGLHSSKPRELLPIIEGVLSDQDPFVRATAAVTLGYITPASNEAMPELIKMLDDKDGWARGGAVYALGMMGKAATEVLPRLRTMLNEEPGGDSQGPADFLHHNLMNAILRIETGFISYYPRAHGLERK